MYVVCVVFSARASIHVDCRVVAFALCRWIIRDILKHSPHSHSGCRHEDRAFNLFKRSFIDPERRVAYVKRVALFCWR